MKNFDIIILGAGASGCMCALRCALKHKKVLLIDRIKVAGKKLMVTGNGRCNITNLEIFPSDEYYNQNIDSYLTRFSPNDTLKYFENLGLICYADDSSRVYPISNSAKSVIDVLNNQLLKYKNLTLLLETEFEDVDYNNGIYQIKTSAGYFTSPKLVVATGGNTALKVFEKFNINTKKFIPSLTALKTQSTRLVENIRISPAQITINCTDKVYSETGEILFKDSGISGIVAFNISSYFARKGSFIGQIKIDILPNYTLQQITNLIKSRQHLQLPINKMFDGIFISAVAYLILNRCNINENRTTQELSNSEINKIAETIKGLTFDVKDFYPNNQIYAGGVLLNALTENLESKSQKGLYFCGEVCDVDGKCGGYNLQWAWTSGYIVGEAL